MCFICSKYVIKQLQSHIYILRKFNHYKSNVFIGTGFPKLLLLLITICNLQIVIRNVHRIIGKP